MGTTADTPGKDKFVVTFYFVDRTKADELVTYGKKIGAGTDITVLPPCKQDYTRASGGRARG